MHLVIGVVCIAAALILDKGEACVHVSLKKTEREGQANSQTAGCCARSWDVTSDESAIAFEFVG